MAAGWRPACQHDKRQPARPERSHDAGRTVGRDDEANGVGADLDPVDDLDRPVSIIDQQKLIRRLIDGEQMAAAGQEGEISQTAADLVLGHDPPRGGVDDREAPAAPVGHEHRLAAVGAGQRDRLAHPPRERAGGARRVPADTSSRREQHQ